MSGPVSAAQLSLTAPAIILNASVSAGTATLTAQGVINEGTGGRITAGTLTGTAGSATLGSAGNQIGTLGSFVTATGLSLVDGQVLTTAGAITSGGPVSLNVNGPLTLTGLLTAPTITLISSGTRGSITETAGTVSATGTVTLISSGDIQQQNGGISAATLTGSSGGVTSLGSNTNQIAALATFGSTRGFTLVDRAALTVGGPVTDPAGVTLSGASTLTLLGTVQTGALVLTGTAITQPGGSLIAASLSGTAGSGDTALTQRTNQIASLQTFTGNAAFSLVNSTPLSIDGAVSAGAGTTITLAVDRPSFGANGSLTVPNGTVSLQEFTPGSGLTIGGPGGFAVASAVTANTLSIGSLTGGPLTIAGALNLTAVSTLNLQSAGAITEAGPGAIRVATLTGNAGSAAMGGANQVSAIGSFTTAGAFAFNNAQTVTVAGPLFASSATLSVTGDLVLNGLITAPGNLALVASGAITQPFGSITTDSLTGSAASATLANGGNTIATLAGFRTTGDFTLTDNRSLLVSAPVDPNTVTLTVFGDLALNSTVTGGTVVLNVTGAIIEGPGGQIVASTLTGSARSATLPGANQIATLGDLRLQTALLLNDAQTLSVGGTVATGQSATIGSQGALNVPGAITAGTPTAPGTVALTANGPISVGGRIQTGTLAVSGGDTLTQTGGTITASTLTGAATGQVSLGLAGVAAIGTVNNFVSASGVALADSAPLRITGTLAASNLAISAVGSLVLDNGVIAANGLPLAAQTGASPALPGSYLQVLAGTNGTATLQQLGLTTVIPLTGTGSTLRFDLPATGGTLSFAGLRARQTDLVLALGSGSATGAIEAANLTVLGARGSAGLTGMVRSQTAFDAAIVSRISPRVDTVYTLNGCAIQAASCTPDAQTLTSIAASTIASTIRPDILVLDVLDLSVTRDRDDPTLVLPNISDRDY